MSATDQESRALRAACGRYPTGVTVVTLVEADGTPVGMTMNSFSTISLDPPLVMFSIAKDANSLPKFRAAAHLAINVLARDQEDLSIRFSRPLTDKWTGVSHRPGLGGAPLLDGAIAHFECVPRAEHDGGDHLIFVCRVERFARHDGKPPLVFYGGRYVDLHLPAPEIVRDGRVRLAGMGSAD